jgi:hypothetical protein
MGASDGGLLRVLRPNTVLSEKTSEIKEYCSLASVGGHIAAERREGRVWGWRCGGSHAGTLESGLSPAHAMIRLGRAPMNYKKNKNMHWHGPLGKVNGKNSTQQGRTCVADTWRECQL